MRNYNNGDRAFNWLFAGGALAFLIYLAVIILAAIGWIIDLVKIIHHINDPLTAMFVLRIVGIFVVPVGSILGLFF